MTDEQVEVLATAIRRIASGASAPDGLEAVAMALAGDGFMRQDKSVAASLDRIAENIGALAESINRLAAEVAEQ